MAKKKGQVVATTREWEPAHDQPLPQIQGTIDSWERGQAAAAGPASRAPPPQRDYAAIEAAVDRITRRVKTRKVTVTETVTEYVDEEVPAEAAEATTGGSPQQVAELAAVAKPVEEPKKMGFFARRKAAKEAKKGTDEPSNSRPETSFSPVVPAQPAARAAGADDAWDPGTASTSAGRAIEAPKPLQSKAAKRTAGKKSAKKTTKKKR